MASAMLGLFATAHAADNGVYAGLSVGHVDSDVEGVSLPQPFQITTSVDDKDTGFKLSVGLRPLDWVAVEMGYVNFGEVSTNTTVTGLPGAISTRTKLTGFDVVGLLFAEVGPVDLFAKGGLIRWDANLRISSPLVFTTNRASDNGTDAVFGAGAQMHFGSLAGRLEYEYFNIGDSNGSGGKPKMISVGVTYTFF
jgi:hypothetical protein